ncbi:hypothetical protein EBU91_03890 [bacterium]|nr:hypothetical protein [bacterium]
MSLTDRQIRELCQKMKIPLATKKGIIFKNEIPCNLEYNKAYFINLEDEYNAEGLLNNGSHWTCFQIAKYPNGKVAPIYFDAYGMPPPEIVKEKIMKFCKQKVPFNTKDIQSLMANACGWYCCAYLHYINNFSHRTGDIYLDTEQFLEYFEDLNKSTNFLKNEYVLKMFFQSEDPKLRKEITTIADTETITEDTNGGIDAFKMQMNV